MADSHYWSTVLTRRMTRRRAIVASGTAASAAAFLAACGGSSSNTKSGDHSPSAGSASLLSKTADTSQQAKRGGAMELNRNADFVNWDPHFTQVGANIFGALLFSRLTIITPAHGSDPGGDTVGDLAESFEFSPDRLTMTFKIRPNAAWHNIAPVNGRLADAEDITATWKRFVAVATNRSTYANEVNPSSPILSVTATDKSTAVMKLAYPMATLPALLSVTPGGSVTILPREIDNFNPKTKPIGTGPFFLSTQEPSSRFVVQRHPGYWDKVRPYVDSVEYFIVPEYATGLAQFKKGALYNYAVRAEDILATKRDLPQLNLYLGDVASTGTNAFFGFKPTDKSVFRDERVRQAYSMSLDRDQFIDVKLNVSTFQKEGIPIKTVWDTNIGAGQFPAWWLDPQDQKKFGPNFKYYQHNIAEAKKLLAAAGFANGVDVISTHISTPDYGTDYPKDVDITEGMAGEAGFRFNANLVNYQTEFIPKYRDSQGNFEGISYRPITPSNPGDPLEGLINFFSKKSGTTFIGMDPKGAGDFSGDPYMEDQLFKARSEVDTEKRRAIVQDLQRYLGQKQYFVRTLGGATGLSLWWPAVKNANVYSNSLLFNFYEWLDDTQQPLKKA